MFRCLNPCCSGQWSSTKNYWVASPQYATVLILVVVDNGLVQSLKRQMNQEIQKS